MRTGLTALAIWGLILPGGCSRPARVLVPDIHVADQQSPEAKDAGQKMALVTLTNEQTVASFPVLRQIVADAPPILEVSVTKVANPAATPVAIFVYLAPVGKKGQAAPDKILAGNFSLYPPDRAGSFLLHVSTAFSELRAKGWASSSDEIRLVLELKRVREAQAWTPIEITISAPKWSHEKPTSQ